MYSKQIGEEVRCAAWDGHFVVAGGSSGDVLVWDLIKDSCVARLEAHKAPVTCLSVVCGDGVSNGGVMVSGSSDGYIALWNVPR